MVEALKTPGAAFIQALTSCDRGWRHPVNITAKVNKLAVDSGFWPLYSIRVKDGRPTYTLNRKIKFDRTKELMTEYLSLMGRYRHLVKPPREDLINEIVSMVQTRAKNVVSLVDQFGDPEGQLETYKLKLQEVPSQKIISPGHGLCQGCGAGVALNQMATAIQMVAGMNVIFTNNTSCSEVSLSKDDVPSYNTPWVHHLFETAATTGDAIATAYRIMQTKGHLKGEIPYVVAIGGDGSTYDIGFQFLKSALVRTGSFGIMNPLLSD
jgi:pyruvate/2-oxoacid:ferredoxin oxidoreductase beta subunit